MVEITLNGFRSAEAPTASSAEIRMLKILMKKATSRKLSNEELDKVFRDLSCLWRTLHSPGCCAGL